MSDTLNIRAFEAFCILAKTESVSRTAEQMKVGIPTVTRWLNQLQEHVGFDAGALTRTKPDGNERQLAPPGHRLLPKIQAVMDACQALRFQASPESASLGFTRSFTGALGIHLHQLNKRSGLSIDVICDTSESLLRQLRMGELDAAIVLSEVFERQGGRTLKSYGEFQQDTVIYLADNHPIAVKAKAERRRDLTSEELYHLAAVDEVPWVWFDKDSLRDLYEDLTKVFLRKLKAGYVIEKTITDQESLYAILLANRGMALLPESVKNYRLPGVRSFRPPFVLPSWKFSVVSLAGKPHADHLQLFHHMIEIGHGQPGVADSVA